MTADYFTTLVRTGTEAGAAGLSMLLIERTEGVTVRKIPVNYSDSSGTGLVSFESVKVPARNLLGRLGEGMKIAMRNFNAERAAMCVASRRLSPKTRGADARHAARHAACRCCSPATGA